MGVVEDIEPPFKRLRLPLRDFDFVSMGRAVGDAETVGSKGIIKRSEFIRIITSALYTLGCHNTAEILQQESGIPLRSSAVNLFRQQLIDEKWDECLNKLSSIAHLDEATVKSASFVILEQKFLGLLENGDTVSALDTLRREIAPVGINSKRVHELSVYLVCPWKCLGSDKDNKGAKAGLIALRKLEKVFPPHVLIPENRLEHLVEKALDVQVDSCMFHNTLDADMSLFSDHVCERDLIPSRTMQILEAHSDEVWFLQFSHNGKYLASSSKDQSAIIWEVKEDEVSLKHVLLGHQKPVITVSWSPDDSQLLTCGLEEVVRCWNVSSGKCVRVYEKPGVSLISCGWLPRRKGIFTGMNDKTICLWDFDGKEIECWKGHKALRISDMVITDNGKKIICISRENTILLLEWGLKFERLIEEEELITSFSLSNDNKFILVNLKNQEIHLWNIEGDPKILCKYKGHTRSRFVIRSCFGGFQQAFIASGSEDSLVYIWHRESGELLSSLPGHSGAVNCVSWNPVNIRMLASASDDRTIRIWG